MKIRAAVLEEIGVERPYGRTLPLKIREVDLEGPGPGEVLVKIAVAGLCHSDLSVIDGNRPRPVPMVLGHEASGVVQDVGPYVDDLQPGDHVVFVFMPSCGHCAPCAEGRPALCEPGAAANGAGELLGGVNRLKWKGRKAHHHVGVSSFADYATVSRRSLVKIDREVPLDIAGLIGCAVLTGAGAVFNTGDVRPGGSTAVVGLGGVGLAALIGAAAAGAETIVAVDRLDSKLEFARELGATHTFNSDDPDVVAKVREATRGGVEAALEFAGSVKALEFSYAITRRGGTTITAGLLAGSFSHDAFLSSPLAPHPSLLSPFPPTSYALRPSSAIIRSTPRAQLQPSASRRAWSPLASRSAGLAWTRRSSSTRAASSGSAQRAPR